MRKFVALITTLGVAFGLSFVLNGPAQSATDSHAGFSSAHSAVTPAAKRGRKVTMKFKATNGGRAFKLHGKVKPCSHKAPIRLQHKNKKKGKWHRFKKKHTHGKGLYAFKHLKTTGFFRAKAPAHANCKGGHSGIIKVVRR